jgi:hypothetical protein
MEVRQPVLLDAVSGRTGLMRFVSDTPNPQQLTAANGKICGKIYELEACESPGKLLMVAGFRDDRNDALFVSILLECIQKLSLHPFRAHCRRREQQDKPIALSQG